ncbi:hypothetical protein AQUSIP_19730 [Aquicella siphonis]|uniref:AsmA domain-containing protein n=2 Tax=Aquicella siphonis TaxID=254247 RepID=A0A5E4PHZ6_9COXI|nr:hypothetical protein AQUSIP_19730 [Aquicella siphonis]
MMKILKTLLSITALILIICILAIGMLVFFADPNKLKPVLVEEVKKTTGYQLIIEGKLSWSFYPGLAVKMEHVLLSAPGQTSAFVDAHDVRMAADLMELLRSKEKLQGGVSIASLRLMNIQAEKVNARLQWKSNILTISPITAHLYQGRLEGEASGRRFTSEPVWNWDVQASNIQIKPLLEDINGKKTRLNLSGTGQMKMQAETSGKTRERMTDNLNGSVSFNLSNGAMEGVDLNYLLKNADALLNKEAVNPPENLNQTEFNRLTGTALISQGVAESKDIFLTAPAFTANAQGTIVLKSRELDLQLQVKPGESARTKWEIPVLITGDVSHPDVRLDTMEIQKILTAQEIDKLKSKAAKEIKKHVPGKTGEFLQNLLR